ncbi:hypothetical protein [Nostoc sp. CALU 546]|uniref:hypothetical protein n=1 Tax=Nostoc sp. CALU 546 TaxID=1867241 RepID=UPI003B6769FB
MRGIISPIDSTKQSNGNGFGNFNLERAVEKELAYLQKNRLGVIWLDTLHRIINEYPGSIIKEELEQGGYTKAISNFEQLCASTKDETLIYLMQGLWLIFHKDKNFSFKNYSPFSGEDIKVVVKLYINTLICVLIAESELSSMQVPTE